MTGERRIFGPRKLKSAPSRMQERGARHGEQNDGDPGRHVHIGILTLSLYDIWIAR